MSYVRWASIMLLLPSGLALSADPPSPVWQGVWQGTVGKLPVRACLARRSEMFSVGSYLYLSRLVPIRLEQQGGSRVWREGWTAPGPQWTFETVGPGMLAGTWREGARTLRFRLTRVADGGEDPCDSAAFNAGRFRPLKLTASPARFEGVTYRRLDYDPGPAFPDVELRTFALVGDDAATRRINAALRREVPGDGEDWQGCVSQGLGARGVDGDYQARVEPTLITRRWLGASVEIGYDCGGPHPDSVTQSLTFDRASGSAVDLSRWLTAVTRDGPDNVNVDPPLRRIIIARAGTLEAECREALDGAERWDIGLTRTGLRFAPNLPHVLQGCAEPVFVPWPALRPFLNAVGRAGAQSLLTASPRAVPR